MNPDPVFKVNPDTDPDPIWIEGFDDQKLKKKNTDENFCWSNIANLLMYKLQEKPSALKREQTALQKNKFIN